MAEPSLREQFSHLLLTGLLQLLEEAVLKMLARTEGEGRMKDGDIVISLRLLYRQYSGALLSIVVIDNLRKLFPMHCSPAMKISYTRGIGRGNMGGGVHCRTLASPP